MDSFKETVLSASASANASPDAQLSHDEIVGITCALLYEDLKPLGNNSFSVCFGDYTFVWKYRNKKIDYTIWHCASIISTGNCSLHSTEWLKKHVHSVIERNENGKL